MGGDKVEVTEEQASIMGGLDRLGITLNSIGDRLDLLDERLAPVILSQTKLPQGCNPEEARRTSPLMAEVDHLNTKSQSIYCRIDEIIEGLEL